MRISINILRDDKRIVIEVIALGLVGVSMISASTFVLQAYAQRDTKGNGEQNILQSEENKVKELVREDKSHAEQFISSILQHKDNPTQVPLVGLPSVLYSLTQISYFAAS